MIDADIHRVEKECAGKICFAHFMPIFVFFLYLNICFNFQWIAIKNSVYQGFWKILDSICGIFIFKQNFQKAASQPIVLLDFLFASLVHKPEVKFTKKTFLNWERHIYIFCLYNFIFSTVCINGLSYIVFYSWWKDKVKNTSKHYRFDIFLSSLGSST